MSSSELQLTHDDLAPLPVARLAAILAPELILLPTAERGAARHYRVDLR